MMVEELLILHLGIALEDCGESCRDWHRMAALLVDSNAFLQFTKNPQVHPGTRMYLQWEVDAKTHSPAGAEKWNRTSRLIQLFQTDAAWQERGRRLWSTTERMCNERETSSSRSTSSRRLRVYMQTPRKVLCTSRRNFARRSTTQKVP